MAFALIVLSFLWWWPVGLLALAFLIARRKRAHWLHALNAGDASMLNFEHGKDRWDRKMAHIQDKMDRVRSRMDRVRNRGDWFGPVTSSSGNHAFDEYRSQTLKRLEDEQREFKDFLERLRFAKDRAEFDQFMNARRQPPFEPNAAPPPAEPRN